MFSSAGRTRTHIGKRQLLGMNLQTVGVSNMHVTGGFRKPPILRSFCSFRGEHHEETRWESDVWNSNLPTSVVEYEPTSYGPEGKEELSRDGE